MSSEPCVLLLSHSEEPFCTERVAGALMRRGARALRIDTDDFPGTLGLSGELADDAGRLLLAGAPLRVDAVWLWRLWPSRQDAHLAAAHRDAALRESMTTLRGLLDLLADAAWIDPLDRNRAADNKTRQLRLARAVGLVIPPTLITADAAAVRRFHAAHDGRVICKLQTSLGYSMAGGGGLPTRLLRPEDLDALADLRHCPMVFQRYVDKALELRIAWVDEPTAALDIDAEGEVFTRVRELARGRTLLLISHRFANVRLADRIFVLADSGVVEQGSHAALMAADGLYAAMFRKQASGYALG